MPKFYKKIIFIIVALTIITSGVLIIRATGGSEGGSGINCAQHPGSCITKGLIAHWAFEEGTGQTATDLSGNGNDGTLGASSSAGTDDPKWTFGGLPSEAMGEQGALEFDGTNDYVKADGVCDDIDAQDFTVTAWVKSSASAAQQFIVAFNDSGGGNRLLLGHPASNADLQMVDTAWHDSNVQIVRQHQVIFGTALLTK